MALLFFDGFDHSGGISSHLTKWASLAGSVVINASVVRTGTGSLAFQFLWGTDELVSKAFPASGGFVVGFATRANNAWNSGVDFLQIREGTTTHLALSVDGSAGHLTVKRGGNALAAGTPPLSPHNWY